MTPWQLMLCLRARYPEVENKSETPRVDEGALKARLLAYKERYRKENGITS